MAATTAPSLLLRLRSRTDAPAWNEFVSMYTPLLHDWLKRYSVQSESVDDLVQEVLQTLVKEMPSFEYDRTKGSFRGWLRTILLHRLRHFQRSQRLRAPAGKVEYLIEQLADEKSELSSLWNQEHDQHVVTQLLTLIRHEFEESSWEAFYSLTIRQEAPKAVADRLRMSLNAVRIAKSRVLNRLQAQAARLGLET